MIPLRFQEDLSLARRCAAGNAEAWQVLVDRSGPRLKRLARRLLGGRDEARWDDAVAEVFAHLLGSRALQGYRGEAPLEAYLVVVGGRLILARAAVPLVPLPAGLPSRAPAPPEQLLEQEEIDTLREVLAGLPKEDRALIGLLYEEGLTHRQAAERLGVPLGTVASRSARLLAHLAGKMQKPGK